MPQTADGFESRKRVIPIDWLRANWHSLTLTPKQALARRVPVYMLPGARGVYLIFSQDRVVYVGSSVNMNARGRQHDSDWAADCTAVAIPVPEEWRKGLEGVYIKATKAPMNLRSPGAIEDVPILKRLTRSWAGHQKARGNIKIQVRVEQS
jgi:hypothetical protein